MPDPAVRRPPLLAETLGVRLLPPACRWVLRGGEEVRAAAAQTLGWPVPASACRAGGSRERAALWLGPDEWLLLAPLAEAGLGLRLARGLTALPHSLVDVSHRQVALEVSGPRAVPLLASGCPLDLEAAAFPVGMCTRTMFAKAEIVLWRSGEEAFRLEVWRSFAAYVASYLTEAGLGIF